MSFFLSLLILFLKAFSVFIFEILSGSPIALIFNSFPTSIFLTYNLPLSSLMALTFFNPSIFFSVLSLMITYQEKKLFLFVHLYIELLDILSISSSTPLLHPFSTTPFLSKLVNWLLIFLNILF